MTPQQFLDLAIVPAATLLPRSWDTAEARALVIAIALQESGLQHREQIGGPARGYTQFEKGGGIKGVLTHPVSRPFADRVCRALDIPASADDVYEAITFNDVLCAAFSRLLLRTSPLDLPIIGDVMSGWRIYVSCWRPGKPHPQTWAAHVQTAWQTVAPGAEEALHV